MPDQTIDASVATPGAIVHSADELAGGTSDWRTSIPADLRSEKSLENIKDLPSLVKGYVEGQRYIGGSVRIPGEKATPEEITAFQRKLGVPEKHSDYKIDRPILPDHAGWNDTVHDKVLEVAHKAGLNTRQAQSIVEGLSGIVASISPDPQKLLAESKATLQKDWGENFGRNLVLSTRAVDHLAQESGMTPAELHAAFAETGAGAHPKILKALSKLGAGMLEQGLIKSEETRLETTKDAESQIKKIKGDPAHPYWDAKHPNHKDAVEEYRRLRQLIENNQ